VSESGAGNNRQAWETQISEMASRIRYYLQKSFSLTKEQAEDITQDTLTAAIERVREPDFALKLDAQLTTFVHSIAKHKAIDYLKYKKIRNHPSLDDAKNKIHVVVDPELKLPEADKAKLKKLVESLPDPQGRILYLVYFEGHKVAEVAVIIGKDATQITALKFAALKKLREWCQEKGITLAVLALALWNLWRLIHGL